jgi:Tol biopolymer transport system component
MFRNWRQKTLGALLAVCGMLGLAGHSAVAAQSNAKMAYTHAGNIWLSNADGTNPMQLTFDPCEDYVCNINPALSPDGTKIAYSHQTGINGYDLYLLTLSGGIWIPSGPIPHTDTPADESEPAWSPDNTEVAFVRGFDPTYLPFVGSCSESNIYAVPVETGDERKLTSEGCNTDPAWSNYPRTSPYANLIAFSSLRGKSQDFEIYTMSAVDGGNVTQITDNAVHDADPAWSQIGGQLSARIAYTSNLSVPDTPLLPPGNMPIKPLYLALPEIRIKYLWSGQDQLAAPEGMEPSWSRDSSTISFTFIGQGGWPGIKLYDVASGNVTDYLAGFGGYWSSSQAGL